MTNNLLTHQASENSTCKVVFPVRYAGSRLLKLARTEGVRHVVLVNNSNFGRLVNYFLCNCIGKYNKKLSYRTQAVQRSVSIKVR